MFALIAARVIATDCDGPLPPFLVCRFVFFLDWNQPPPNEMAGDKEYYKGEIVSRFLPDKHTVTNVISRHAESSAWVDGYGWFCNMVLPETEAELDDPKYEGVYTCTRNVPGTDVFAFASEGDDHMGANGAIYLWPKICAVMQTLGLYS